MRFKFIEFASRFATRSATATEVRLKTLCTKFSNCCCFPAMYQIFPFGPLHKSEQ